MAATASRSTTDVCVKPPGLKTIPSVVVVSLVQPFDERAFVVVLEKLERHVGKRRAEVGFEVGQRGMAVRLRLACTEQVQVRPVEDQDGQDSGVRVEGCGGRI